MGWLGDVMARPFINMHQHLHRLRMAQPPAEQPETFIVADARPFQSGNRPPLEPPKPPKMREQGPMLERRETSPMRPKDG